MGLFDIFNNEEEEMQELVQNFVDDVMSTESLLLETDPQKRKELFEDIVKDKSIDFALSYCEDNPKKVEKELEKVFGKAVVCQISN